MQKPSVGRIVHYVEVVSVRAEGAAEYHMEPICRAAIVTNVMEGNVALPVQLTVFPPKSIPHRPAFGTGWVLFSPGIDGVLDTWHWPEVIDSHFPEVG